MNTEHITEVINKHFSPNFFQDWEINLLIGDCREQNAQTEGDVLRIIDEYLTGIENSI